MLIHGLELVNFCQHEARSLSFVPGLNMLIGPNGGGKTNILRALQLALIGDAGGDRNKAEDIRQGAELNAQSYIEMHMTHAGAEIHVRRGLRPNESALTVDTQSYRGIATINAELWRRLGASKKQIQDYVFVRQRKIDEMFDQKPADRAASLAALFGVDQTERIWRALGDFTNRVEVPTTTLDADDLRRKAAEYTNVEQTMLTKIAALDMPDDVEVYVQAREQIVNTYTAMVALIAEMSIAQDKKMSTIGRLQVARESIAMYAEEMNALTAAQDAISTVVTSAANSIKQWDTYDAAIETRAQLCDDEHAFHARWESLQPPAALQVPRLAAMESNMLRDFREAAQQHRAAMRTLKNSPVVCPTCGQDMPNMADRDKQLRELALKLDNVVASQAPLEEREAACAAYDSQVAEFTRNNEQKTCEQTMLDQRNAALAAFDPPETSRDASESVLAENASYRNAIVALEKVVADKRLEMARLDGESEQRNAQAQTVADKMDMLHAYSREQMEAARDELAAVRRKQSLLLSELEPQRASAAANRASVEQQLQDVQAIEERSQRTREVVEHFNAIRTIFHRNEAPRLVSYTYVEAMISEINNTLELFEAPFRVEMSEELGFTARFLDGVRVQADSRLSVGERIVLAMAFRVTVNSTFASQIGVLVLDEPTAGLDEHNLGCLPRALERLRDLSQSRGLQVVFVTHENRIHHLFDNVIELPAA